MPTLSAERPFLGRAAANLRLLTKTRVRRVVSSRDSRNHHFPYLVLHNLLVQRISSGSVRPRHSKTACKEFARNQVSPLGK